MLTIGQLHWKLIVLCALLTGLVTAVYTLLQPKIYRAESKLLVRTGRQQMVMGSDAGDGHGAPPAVTEEDVNSEIELLRSQAVLNQVADDCGLTDSSPSVSPKVKQLAILKLFKHLDVSAVRKTNVIAVSYFANSPEAAVSVVRSLNARYLTASLAAHESPNSYSFFANEMVDAQRKMDSAQQQASAFHVKTQIYSAEEQRTALIKSLSDIRTELYQAEARLQELRSRDQALNTELAKVPDRTSTQERTVVNLPLVEKLQSNLNDLESSRIVLLAKYKSTDSLVKVVDAQIASTRAELATTGRMAPSERTTDANPLYQVVIQQIGQNRVDLQGLTTREQALKAIETETLNSLEQLNRNSVVLANLDRNQQSTQENYTLYEKRLEQARISRQMDQDRIANVAVIESPLSSPVPVGPSVPLNLLVGLSVGTLLGFCAGWLRDVRSASTAQKIRRDLFVSTMASQEVSA